MSRTTTPTWLHDEPALGNSWRLEYAMFCLGHGLVVAGALRLQYLLGKADRDIELALPRTRTRSIVSG